MESAQEEDDVQAIEELIERQFRSLGWSPGTAPDWDGFVGDFFPGASLFPASRPVKRQAVNEFVQRLADLGDSKLRSFREQFLGARIHVFGNIAVAVAGCEFVENESEVSRGVEMLLLVKSEGRWEIAAQAWDMESPDRELPADLGRTRAQ